MGCGSIFSYYYGKKDDGKMQESMFTSFLFVGVIAIVMNAIVFAGIDVILKMLQIPADIYGIMKEYTWAVFWGIFFVFLYNFFAFLLRAVGNSMTPLLFLGAASFIRKSPLIHADEPNAWFFHPRIYCNFKSKTSDPRNLP